MVTSLNEVPVQIPQRSLQGWLFVAYILITLSLLLQLVIRLEILQWIIPISFSFLFIYTLAKISNRQIKAGPGIAWFRRGMIDAWVSLDGEDLVVRTIWKGQEAFRPSRIEWTMPREFTVKEGDTSFDLVFQSPDEAARFASRMKANIPKIVETTLLS